MMGFTTAINLHQTWWGLPLQSNCIKHDGVYHCNQAASNMMGFTTAIKVHQTWWGLPLQSSSIKHDGVYHCNQAASNMMGFTTAIKQHHTWLGQSDSHTEKQHTGEEQCGTGIDQHTYTQMRPHRVTAHRRTVWHRHSSSHIHTDEATQSISTQSISTQSSGSQPPCRGTVPCRENSSPCRKATMRHGNFKGKNDM